MTRTAKAHTPQLTGEDDGAGRLLAGTLSARWEVSPGCSLLFGPRVPGTPLRVLVDVSQHDGGAWRETTPEELRQFAAYLVRVAEDHERTR